MEGGQIKEARMKRLILALAVVAVVLTSGVAAANMLSTRPSPSPRTEKDQARLAPEKASDESEEAGAGVHGGPIERFHETGGCSLVDVSTLIPTAAHSDCGKPMVSVGHRHGPPDFVQHKLEARKTGGDKGPKDIPGS